MKNKTFSLLRGVFVGVLAMLSTAAMAQLTATGVVEDAANGEPIIGASVLEVGTTNGTITDFDGNFSLKVANGATLSISYMGYKSQELPAAQNMKIRLGEDSELLDEVVVVGYGVVKKNDATGSVTAIKPDDMNKGLVTNAQDMLSGKIAGVSVTSNSGAPGAGATIRIRGGSSLSASNDPLIVIDGLAMDNNGIQGVSNPLAMVNPSDIETFTVLKDASATAIYGSRASNGVIIITTKKGTQGQKPKFSYEGNVSVSNLTNRLEVLTGDEIRDYAYSLGHSAKKLETLGTFNSDWQKQIYRPAISTDHNISVTGGTKHMPYRASIGYTDQNGIIKTSNMQRVTASFNLNPTFLDKHLTFNINAKGMYIFNRYADGGVVGAALSMDPTMPVLGGADDAQTEIINKWFGGYYQRVKTSNYNDDAWPYTTNKQTTANPLGTLMQKRDNAHSGSFVGNFEVDYKIHGFEDLRLHANFGADYSYGKQTTVVNNQSYSNHYWGWNGYTQKSKYNLQFNAYAQYYKDFSDTQHFDAMVGYEWQHFYNDGNSDGWGVYPMTNNDKTKQGTEYNRNPTEWVTENSLVSFFGRVNYIGWNRYMLTATLRADGSSRFAPDTRWGYFPSVALGWKIKEEAFLKDVNWLSELKLRLGYGITGQQDLNQGDYPYLATYTLSQAHAYYPVGSDENILKDDNGNVIKDADGNIIYYNYRPNAVNAKLTWEKTTTYNAGIDFGFLNGRITGAIDYYYRNTTDLINVIDIPAGTNFKNRVISNVGSLRNTGVEFTLNAVAIDTKTLKWDLGFNLTYNDNKITKLNTSDSDDYYLRTGGISSGTDSYIQAHKVGYAASTFYVYETKKGEDKFGTPCWYVVDRNGDGTIDVNDRYFHKSPMAPVTMGFQTKWQFYGVDLGFTLRASIGNYVYNDVLASSLQWVDPTKFYQQQNGGYHSLLRKDYDIYYTDNMRSDAIYAGDPLKGEKFNDWFMTDYFVENASFLRCDNITIGYTFDKKVTKDKVHARIYATVQNPFVISGYRGLDPEVFGGIDNNMYPRSMTSLIGLSLQF